MHKSVQASYLQSTTNILKNKVLDLEFNIYHYEKLTEALVDVIQSHDPNFVLEEEEILKSYLDQNKASPSGNQRLRPSDQYLEPGCSSDLDLYSDVKGKNYDSFEDLISSMSIDISSISTDTCATTNSLDTHTDVPRKNPDKCENLVPSISTDTCSTIDSLHSGTSLAESVEVDTYETSARYSESDTCSLYSDFPTNGSS